MIAEDYTEVHVGNQDRCLIVHERGDEEMTVMAVCMTALRDLDANAAARVAHYVAERHPFVEAAASTRKEQH